MGLGFEGTHAAHAEDQTSCQPIWLECRQVACAAFARWRRGRRVGLLTLKPGDAPSPARPSHAEKQELRRPERGDGRLVEMLQGAEAGWFSPCSWTTWHRKLGITPTGMEEPASLAGRGESAAGSARDAHRAQRRGR